MGIETTTIEVTGKGIGWIWTNVIKPYINKSKNQRQEMLDKINAIHNEVKFNGGGSIKDAVSRIEIQVATIDTKINGIQENQDVAMNLQGIAFWKSTESGSCEYASTNLCKMLGRNETEILGNAWVAWIVPEDRERIHDAWIFSVENKSAFDETYTYKKSDGKKQKVWGLAFHKKIDGNHAGTMGKLEAVGEPF